jgi:hypothetical protein
MHKKTTYEFVLCLENLIAQFDGIKTVIIDQDEVIPRFEIESDDIFQIRQAILVAFYLKMDIKNKISLGIFNEALAL